VGLAVMAALDIPKFYRKARNQFAVRHKITGEILGYALLLPDISVEDCQLKLVPWQDDDLHTSDPDLTVHDPKAAVVPTILGASLQTLPVPEVNLSLSVSSEDGSRNGTLTSDSALEHLPAKQADFNASISLAKAPTSTPEPRIDVACSSLTLSSVSETSSLSVKSSYIPVVSKVSPISTVVVKEANDGVVDGTETRSETGGSEFKSRFVSERESVTQPKEAKNEKVECEKPFLPGVAGRYDKFLQFVNDGKNSGVEKKRRKVICLLCGAEYVYGNIGRHIQTSHEDPVICEICHIQFNAKRSLSDHKRKVHKKQWMEETNNNDKTETVDAKVLSKVSPPPFGVSTPPTTVQDVKKSIPVPISVKMSSKLVSIVMSSDTVKGVRLKMGLEKDAKIKKAMRKFGNRFKVDYKSLKFFQGGTELTGREIVGDMNGNEVIVFGELKN